MADATDQTLVSSTDGPEGEPTEQLVLVCLGSPERNFVHAGAVHPLHGLHCVRFGRSADDQHHAHAEQGALELQIPLPWVSSRHAELHLEGPGLRVVDHGSRNGTHIEGQAVQTRAMLGLGKVLEVGRSFWLLRLVRRSALAPLPDQPLPRMANPEVHHLRHVLARLAPSNVPILVTGETGTGKERLARSIHAMSGRSGPFVPVSLAAGSLDRLLRDSPHLHAARGGTLYLDDVGELSPEEQNTLTSTLMSHAPSDWQLEHPRQGELRLVASSTRDLRAMVASGAFRPDLMARLAGFEARLPPLRARREDLGPLVLETLAAGPSEEPPRLTTEVFRAMLAHSWPFNLRELHHSLITAANLVDPERTRIDPEIWGQACWTVEGGDATPNRIEAVRRELVQQMAHHRGELSAVAAALRCEIEDIRRWADRFSLQPERYRDVG